VREHIALGDLAEPLGFDSLFVLEHHFSGYLLSPAPFEMLAFYAGRTHRLLLGTAAIVLPWHDPIRVAEQIAVVDIMSGGRCIFAFGRGRSLSEFNGFRVPMDESRGRFIEAAEIVVRALTFDKVEYEGQFYKISPVSIRPRPESRPHERFYGAAMGKESIGVVARLGFGMLTSTQKAWAVLHSDICDFRQVAQASGKEPPGPIVVASVSVAESRQHAQDRAIEYFGREWRMIDDHYGFSVGQVAAVEGYESYASTEAYFRQLADSSFREKATAEYAKLQIVGTPAECAEQIDELTRLTGAAHLALEFSYGGLPAAEAEANLRLFASRVLPVLKGRDTVAAKGL
jgi:alkanesulfonate monooxygenase SsuD/methylene tetrahydromethanopterin reductase-like flavin-dependent oxidoreductase (luciferase family)